MPVHFDAAEMAQRVARACEGLKQHGLDALLMFKQESMYYLSGYDTFGFSLFQCLVLTADGRLALLTRLPDLRQARHTSNLADIRIWADVEGARPEADLTAMLVELGLRGCRVGIELDSYGLKAQAWERLRPVLTEVCVHEDASTLIDGLRAVKSDAEMAFVRQAAALADDAWDAAIESSHAGAFEGDILAAMQGAVFKGGGDYAGNEFIIGSGNGALLCRYFSGRRHLDAQDQMTLEFAGAYRRYHAAMMRTLLTGTADARHREMHAACVEALQACEQAIRPGVPMGAVFDAHASAMDAAGMREHRMNACGYGMGAVFNPLWVDPPMFYHGNPLLMRAGNVFFLHMILMDSESGHAMSLGHTVRVHDGGCEVLSRSNLDLVVN